MLILFRRIPELAEHRVDPGGALQQHSIRREISSLGVNIALLLCTLEIIHTASHNSEQEGTVVRRQMCIQI